MMLIILLAGEVERPEVAWAAGYAVIGFIALIFLINIAALIYLNFLKIRSFLRVRKAKKQVQIMQQKAVADKINQAN